MSIDRLDDIAQIRLTKSYIRRKSLEARMIAQQVGVMLFGEKKDDIPAGTREISLEEMMAITGVGWEN